MTKSTPNRFPAIVVAILLLVCIVTVLLMACVPPVSRDALTHHLAVPKIWIEKGGMAEIPHLDFSYYPMNLNLLYAIPMRFGNDIIPKYIHFLFALATAGLVYSYLKQRTTRTLALMGALFFLSTPVIVKLSISVYVDLGLIFFTWASIYYLFAWAHSSKSLKHLIFSAIMCGLGLGTKYNGIIVLVLLTLFIPILYIRAVGREQFKVKNAVGYPILFFLIAMSVFSPWMIKNYHLTGNPIYPLYKGRIGNEAERSEISNMSMKPWLQRKLIYRESALETALIPLRVFFQGQDDNPRYFDGKLNPILFVLPLLLFLSRRESNTNLKLELLLLAFFSVLFLLYASFMVDMRIRYIAPIVPPLVVLTVLGIGNALRWVDGIGRKGIRLLGHWLVLGGVFFCLSMNATYAVALFQSVDPVPYVSGKMSREDYIESKLPDYPAIQFVNRIENDKVKILALFLGKRLYYFDKFVDFGTQAFANMVAVSTDEFSLFAHLRKNGFTHCVIGVQHFETWANQVFSNEQKKKISQWLRDDCQLLFSKNGYDVLKLNEPGTTGTSKY